MSEFPFSPFARPTGSFQYPVEPPVAAGGSCSELTLTFPEEWKPYIIGALQQLLLQTTWIGSDAIIQDTQERAAAIIGTIQGAVCVTGPEAPGIGCGDDMASCGCFRQQGTALQMFCCGEWQTIYDPGSGQPGAPQTLPAPNGGNQSYCFELGPRDLAFLPATVNSGDQLLIQTPDGAWNDGTQLSWFCPNGYQYILGTCNALPVTNQGQQLLTAPYMGIICKIGTALFDIYNRDANGNPQPFTVPGGISNQQVFLLANFVAGPTALPPGGAVKFCVQVTNNQAGSFTHTWDFGLSPYSADWNPVINAAETPSNNAAWTPPYVDTLRHVTAAPVNTVRSCAIHSTVPTHITRIQVFGTLAFGSTDVPGTWDTVDIDNGGTTILSVAEPTVPTFPIDTGPISIMVTDLLISLASGVRNDGADPGGSSTITKIIVEGTGTDPY